MKPIKIARMLGQDDWLIFARTEDGRLVYTVIETDPVWLSAPHEGDGIYGSREWRADNAYVLEHVTNHANSYYWRECGSDTDGTYLGWPACDDDGFTAQSARTYLPVPGDLHATAENRDALYRNAITYLSLHTRYGPAFREEVSQAYAGSFSGVIEPMSPADYLRARESRDEIGFYVECCPGEFVEYPAPGRDTQCPVCKSVFTVRLNGSPA